MGEVVTLVAQMNTYQMDKSIPVILLLAIVYFPAVVLFSQTTLAEATRGDNGRNK